MSLYIPGYGLMSSEELAVDQACRAHDSQLTFRRSERTGNFTIFQRVPRDSAYRRHADAADLEGGDLFPVCGFPHRRMPSVDEVQKWLYLNDEMRQSTIDKVKQHNAKIQKGIDDKDYEERHERAVFLEHGMRMLGTDTGVVVSTRNSGKRRRTFG